MVGQFLKKITKQVGRDVVEIHVEGDNNSVNVYPQTAELLEEPKSLESTQELVKPLLEEGYESLEFEYSNGESEKITKDDVLKISKAQKEYTDESEIREEPQEFTALL